MNTATFDDLLDLRVGGPDMSAGAGATRVTALTTLGQWRTKAAALRELYIWTLGEKPANYDCPLDLRDEGEAACDGLTKRTVSYAVGPGERIKAYVLIPHGSGPFPAMATVHPANKIGREQTIGTDTSDEGMACAYGLHLAQRGYVTISYDLISTGERIYPGLEHFDNGPFIAQHPTWSGRGKDLHDLTRAIDVLEQTAEVDAQRIGVIGHSQGGGIATDAMAVEPRLKVAVNNCGDWPFRLNKNPFNRCRTSWWIGLPRLRPFAIAGKAMPIDLHEKLALAASRPVLNIMALDDCQFTAAEQDVTRAAWENLARSVRQVYALHGCADGYRQLLHVKGHSFGEAQRAAAYDFLDEHLGQKKDE